LELSRRKHFPEKTFLIVFPLAFFVL